MADARREEGGGELGDERDVRRRSQTTDHPERIKPDHLHSSQGPLSSIRAAIKRPKTNTQSDPTRERRRPEITIISAEPLASNNWFPGTSVVYPSPPPPHHQSGWSAGIGPVSQCPPSYDQVIQEKTRGEHIVRPTAAPRRTTCTTSATQTDPVRENTSASVPQSAEKQPAGKKPQKPPRPSLLKPLIREPAPECVARTDETLSGNTRVSAPKEEVSHSDINQPNPADSTPIRSVTVHWDIPTYRLCATAAETSPETETSPPSSDVERRERPIPLPRTKYRKQTDTEVAKVQTLVKAGENCGSIHSDPNDIPSKYLKDLLEVFSADNDWLESGNIFNQSDEALQDEDVGEMNPSHSQRDIRARIQAFEVQASTVEGDEPVKPDPPFRKLTSKPPVAAKPPVALKPHTNHSIDDSQNVSSADVPPHPTPAPKPPKKPMGLSIKQELEALHSKAAVPNRSRPSVLTRANCIFEEDNEPAPPTLPVRPVKEPLRPNLNINNHNSTSVARENVYVDSPSHPVMVQPLHDVDSRQTVTRRPTTIRVPSKSDTFSDRFQDSPPPLPAQKPVGNPTPSVEHRQSPTPILPLQTGPEPQLPPRRTTASKSLPPRPPSAKIGPGRPPPPNLQATGRSHTASWDMPQKPPAKKPKRKGPVLPPRPNPGHRLYNKYTLQLPHGIAAFDYDGSNTGELSLQKNEVLLLLGEMDHDVFECQAGDARGRVHTSHMRVITPLDSDVSPPQDAGAAGPDGADTGLQVRAIHDFTPEGPGELALRAGDVVTTVEQVDREWYQGSCRGSTGFFPINYVTVLSNSPKPLPGRKAKPPPPSVSGPRCVARFDFEGEHSDELSFSEGDVIQLKAYVGQDWARGQTGVFTGIFPLNFVEIVEDLPPPSSQQEAQSTGIALPGMVAPPSSQPEVANSSQAGVEWAVALYDFAGNANGDLSFQRGDCILITEHIDADWSSGRLDGREGMFPRAFVESSASTNGQQPSGNQRDVAAGGGRARAMYDFASGCNEELCLQVGDIVTNLESLDEEWFLGDLRGRRALVPKNYVQVLD